MNPPLKIPLRPSTQTTVAGTTTGKTTKLWDSGSELVAVLDISAIGLLTQAADELDVYIDASHDGSVWFNVGRFGRITGVDSVYATGTLTSTGAITSAVHAQSTITSTGVNVSDGDTVTIDTTVYRFKTVMVQAYDVQIGADAATTLANLKKAINASGTAGTEYYTGTLIHPTVTGHTLTTTTLLCAARAAGTAANTIATTKSAVTLSWTGTTLNAGTAGVNGETVTVGVQTYTFVATLTESFGNATAVVNEILYGSSVTTAFANLASAINASAGAGTSYSTGTTANAGATSTASDATTVSLQATAIGTPGNSIATTETMANGAFGATTLTGGTYGPGVITRQALKWSSAILESSQPVTIESDISSTTGGIRQVGTGAYIRYRGVLTGTEPDFTYSVTLASKK